MKKKEIDVFEKLQTQLEGFYDEVNSMSKKLPNDALNKFKLQFINSILEDCNALLKEQYKPFKNFNRFEDADLPSNSDVAFMISQYLNCMEKLRSDDIFSKSNYDGNKYLTEWFWKVDGKESALRTAPPKKLKDK